MRTSLHPITYATVAQQQVQDIELLLQLEPKERILIISDLHLSVFERKTSQFLEKLFSRFDTIIINGDFWDDQYISFEDFISSQYRPLFAVLHQKNTIYLFGNHDMPARMDNRVFSFCSWAGFRVKLRAGRISAHIEHGHLLSQWYVLLLLRLFENKGWWLWLLTTPIGFLESWAKQRYLKSVREKKQREHHLKSLNTYFQKMAKQIVSSTEYFIMGHTHVPQYAAGDHYINLGFSHERHYSYIVVENNTLTFVTEFPAEQSKKEYRIE